ncbi:unnamed protein product [Brassica oleracea]
MDKAQLMDQFFNTCSDNNSFDAELSRLRENAWEYVLHLYLTLTFDFFEGFEPTDTEGHEHLDINPRGPQFNFDDLEIPEELVAAFVSASPPQLLPPPPPVNKAPPPPLPPHVNDSAPPDGISQRLTEAHRLAEQASVMVNTLSLDGSIKLNANSVAHLEDCHVRPILQQQQKLYSWRPFIFQKPEVSTKMSHYVV